MRRNYCYPANASVPWKSGSLEPRVPFNPNTTRFSARGPKGPSPGVENAAINGRSSTIPVSRYV